MIYLYSVIGAVGIGLIFFLIHVGKKLKEAEDAKGLIVSLEQRQKSDAAFIKTVDSLNQEKSEVTNEINDEFDRGPNLDRIVGLLQRSQGVPQTRKTQKS